MGLFKRLEDILTANVNDLIDKAENPLKTVRQIIRDIDDEIISEKVKFKDVSAKTQRLRNSLDKMTENINLWTERSKNAVAQDNDILAKHAIARKKDLVKEFSEIEAKWWESSQMEQSLAVKIRNLEDKAQEARRHKDSIIAKSRRDSSSSDFMPIDTKKEDDLDNMFKQNEVEKEFELLKRKKN